MNSMLETIIISFKFSFAENANNTIYVLKRIPLIGKKIPDRLYKATNWKLALGILGEIMAVIGGFFKKSLYLGLMILLPAYLTTKNMGKSLPAFLNIFFFLSIVLGTFMGSIILNSSSKKAFNMIILMRCDAREYYLGEIIFHSITDFIYFILPMIIIGYFIGLSPLKAVELIIELTFLRMISEMLQLLLYRKYEKNIFRNGYITGFVIISCLALAYIFPILKHDLNLQWLLFSAVTAVIIVLLGAASFVSLWNFKGYIPVARSILKRNTINNIDELTAEMKFGDVKINESKMTKEDLSPRLYEKKHGYDYFNALFFRRHKRIMVNPIKTRVIVIAAIFVIASVALIFMPEQRPEAMEKIKNSAPLLVFLMYSMSTGERICKAMFYNCDISMLRYAYYRQSKVILSSFTYRLKRTLLLNIIPALAICIAIAGIFVICGYAGSVFTLMPLFISSVALACFFSIHHLFMYYVVQPYTSQLKVKSPIFSIVNTVIYIASYACLRIKTPPYYFTLGVILVTILYMITALILIYKLAPKTFRIK